MAAIENRVLEGARGRADLSRRLAETEVEAEAAGAMNRILKVRVRVRGCVVMHACRDQRASRTWTLPRLEVIGRRDGLPRVSCYMG